MLHERLNLRLEPQQRLFDAGTATLAQHTWQALHAGFDCRDVFRQAAEKASATEELARHDFGNGYLLPNRYIFADPALQRSRLALRSPLGRFALQIDNSEQLHTIHATLTAHALDVFDGCECPLLGRYLQQHNMIRQGRVEGVDAVRRWFRSPGIYRLQHAQIMFRGESATVVSDYHLFSTYGKEFAAFHPRALGKIDAVVISHGHEDHWHPGALLTLPRDTLLILPPVAVTSMLCPNLMRQARELGFERILQPQWNSTIRVGDIEIHTLPFYGEQPWVRDQPRHAGMRNWGHTFVVSCNDLDCWLLVDSGTDIRGAMTDVADTVRERFGKPDIVMSNLREFGWFPRAVTGRGEYFFCFDVDQLNQPELLPDRAVLTLGPEGVADVLNRCGARYFFPYAHWWARPGTVPRATQPKQDESSLVRQLDDLKPASKVRSWAVGDRLLKQSGALTHQRYLSNDIGDGTD